MENSVPTLAGNKPENEKDIEDGKFAIGDILPNEYQLCGIYSVSRITMRGALSRLNDLGKIKRIKGKGTV